MTKEQNVSSRKRYVTPEMEVCLMEAENLMEPSAGGENQGWGEGSEKPTGGAKQARYEQEMIWEEMDYEEMGY